MCLPSDGLQLGLVDFSSADIDTIILRRFEKGNDFAKLIDTLQWDQSNVTFYSRADTFQMGEFIGGILLQSKFDYEVVIPAVSRTFHITEIDEPQADGDCLSRVKCENSIVSCKLDKGTTQINNGILYLTK
jgi:hypothetical protein